MGKKKRKGKPDKFDEGKRLCLSWHIAVGNSETSGLSQQYPPDIDRSDDVNTILGHNNDWMLQNAGRLAGLETEGTPQSLQMECLPGCNTALPVADPFGMGKNGYHHASIYTKHNDACFGIIGTLFLTLNVGNDLYKLEKYIELEDCYEWKIIIKKYTSCEDEPERKCSLLLSRAVGDFACSDVDDERKDYAFACTSIEVDEHTDALCTLAQREIVRLVLSISNTKAIISVHLNKKVLTKVSFAGEEKSKYSYGDDLKTVMFYYYGVHESVHHWKASAVEFDADQGVENLFNYVKKEHQDNIELYTSKLPNELFNHNYGNWVFNDNVLRGTKENSEFATVFKDEMSDSGFGVDMSSTESFIGVNSDEDDVIEDVFVGKQSENSVKNEKEGRNQHPALIPCLRKYQDAAVRWMIYKETTEQYENRIGNDHVLWSTFSTLDAKDFMYNMYTARFTTSKLEEPPLPTGGILADEMGLGKSVEVLACILNNPCLEKFRLEKSSDAVINCSAEYGNNKFSEKNHDSTTNIEPSNKLVFDSELFVVNTTFSGKKKDLKKIGLKNDLQCSSSFGQLNNREIGINKSIKRTQSMPCLPSQSIVSDIQTCKEEGRKNVFPVSYQEISGQRYDVSVCSSSKDDVFDIESRTLSLESNTSDFLLEDTKLLHRSEGFKIQNSENSIEDCSGELSADPVMTELSESSDAIEVAFRESVTTTNAVVSSWDCHEVACLDTNSKDMPDGAHIHVYKKSKKSNKAIVSAECCICGQSGSARCNKNRYLFCTCTLCGNRMHLSCAGYRDVKVQQYECPSCSVKESIDSHCTLIISPETIVNQWEDEITKHVKEGYLRYMVYKGVAKEGFIQPKVLAEYDVIITTYSTLRADFYHVMSKETSVSSSRSLRHKKKYAALPSPLMSIGFWRVCLDEAQMVESPTSRTAEMAARIRAKHRWCVTGTPVNKGLEDIYGLLVFLGVFPYCQKVWWKKLLYEPYLAGYRDPLFRLLAKLLWRTAKKDVLDQINIPQQSETMTWLRFSPIEHHFYHRQQEECTRYAVQELRKWHERNVKISTLDKQSLHRLLAPLLKLRKACCHPGVVAGASNLSARRMLTMDKLLQAMTDKAKLECVEAHRQLLCAINGLAAISIIQEKYPDAVEHYREAMQIWTEHEDVKTDSLQKLHTLYNLHSLLAEGHQMCSHTVRDGQLLDEASKLKTTYMEKANSRVEAAEVEFRGIHIPIDELSKKINWKSPWWCNVIEDVKRKGEESEKTVVDKIKEELAGHNSVANDQSIRNKFTTLSGLQYLLFLKWEAVMNLRRELLSKLETIKAPPSSEAIQKAAECCLRPVKNSGAPRCAFCLVDDIFTDYETTLFAHKGMVKLLSGVRGNTDNETTKRYGGLRADTEMDNTFKILYSVSKQFRMNAQITEEGKDHLNYIESTKKEFKALREIWFALHQRVSALDELEMCTTRLRLRLPGEPESEERHVIDRSEVEATRLTLMSDKLGATNEVRKKKAQLIYLKNLAKAEDSVDGFNPELCPICTSPLGVEWAVFSCGHCCCCDCAYILQKQNVWSLSRVMHRAVTVKCPLCRTAMSSLEISYVTSGKKQLPEEELGLEIKGNHSTKVEAIVRKILRITVIDPEAKILIFSTWSDVLSEVAKALLENDISLKLATGNNKQFQHCLAQFKHDLETRVLLLPLLSGAKGLNIIEATHVVLTEPILNQANELQAIGRIHRMGQTKPTFVHRFVVQGTIEERMQDVLKRKLTQQFARDSQNCSLTIGDLSTLFQEDSGMTSAE